MKSVTLFTATFGRVEIDVAEVVPQKNTFIIGNKKINFSDMVPEEFNLHDCEDYSITIFDGVKANVVILVNSSERYSGVIDMTSPKIEH